MLRMAQREASADGRERSEWPVGCKRLLGNRLPMTDALPGLSELFLFVGGWLQPVGNPPVLLTAVRTLDYFGGGEHERRGRSRDLVHNDPVVAHYLIERCAEWDRMALTQCFDLKPAEMLGIATVRNDVDAASVSCGRHYIPTEQGQPVAAIIEAHIAGQLRIERHSENAQRRS